VTSWSLTHRHQCFWGTCFLHFEPLSQTQHQHQSQESSNLVTDCHKTLKHQKSSLALLVSWWMNEWIKKDVERSEHGCTCKGGLRISTKKTSVSIVGVPTKIWSRHRSQALPLCKHGLFIHTEKGIGSIQKQTANERTSTMNISWFIGYAKLYESSVWETWNSCAPVKQCR
jgi:hypothetical protein